MTKMLSRMLVVSTAATLLTCGNNPGHYEDVTRVRGIGAISSPVVAAPSTTTTPSVVTLTFYAAAPLGTTITPTVVSDSEGVGPGTAAVMSLIPNTAHYENHTTLTIYSVQATFTVPTADKLSFLGSAHVATLHYALQLTAPNYPTEILAGNALIFEPGASQLTNLVGLPKIVITAPTSGGTVGNASQTINADLTTPVNSETFRIGWFANDGSIDNNNDASQNRNAATTTWNPGRTGAFTLIVTTRGATSGAFAYAVVDTTVN